MFPFTIIHSRSLGIIVVRVVKMNTFTMIRINTISKQSVEKVVEQQVYKSAPEFLHICINIPMGEKVAKENDGNLQGRDGMLNMRICNGLEQNPQMKSVS